MKIPAVKTFLAVLGKRPQALIKVNQELLEHDQCRHWQRTASVRPDGSTGYV